MLKRPHCSHVTSHGGERICLLGRLFWAHPHCIFISSAIFAQLITMACVCPPSKVSPPMGESEPHLIPICLDPWESDPQLATMSIQSFSPTAHPCSQHTDRHTDYATGDLRSSRPHLYTICM